MELKIGDKVVCYIVKRGEEPNLTNITRSLLKSISSTPIFGTITKIYDVTGMGRQVMVRTNDGRLFHAPIEFWNKIKGE